MERHPRIALMMALFCAATVGCNGEAGADDGGSGQGTPLSFVGKFTMGETIPSHHKCLSSVGGTGMGDNVSPELEWSGGPAGTKSYALVLNDTRWGSFHWAVFDIPAGTNSLPEGIEAGVDVLEPAGAHQTSVGGGDEYFGPCSDAGPLAGVYEFALHALDVEALDLQSPVAYDDLKVAIEQATLETVTWQGMPE